MSLFGSIQMGGNTLQAMQIGLQVVGNNIANASTPGYVRQEALFVPAGVQKQGNLILGLGVSVDSIIQKIDKFVQARLIGARGDRAGSEVKEHVYKDMELMLNELDDQQDLSKSMTSFFNSIHDILQSGDAATRNLTVGLGVRLAENINDLHDRASTVRDQLDQRVTSIADEINSLAEDIRTLNVQIASSEGGDSAGSEAGGLRVKRQSAVDRLSEILGVSVAEQPSGGLNISVGGEFLVFEGQRREVTVNTTSLDGTASGTIEFVGTNSPLTSNTGELSGLYEARDGVVGGFLDKLDDLAKTLAFEFNKVYSQGQGEVGFGDLTSTNSVTNPNAALDEAGLAFTPEGGSFDLIVHSKDAPLTDVKTTTINIQLNGLDEDTTLASLAEQLDAVDGISATINSSGQLRIKADSTDTEFAFLGDTSGVLAALGLNTFFTGSTAASIGVNDEIKGTENVGKFAASSKGIGQGSDNAVKLAGFMEQPLDSAGGAKIGDIYNQLITEITQGSAFASSVADGFRTFEGALDGQAQAVSGVNIDEEAVKMLTLQRIYQASAKYIQTLSELLDLLTQL
jgi:flagellar hook-associated protein 1